MGGSGGEGKGERGESEREEEKERGGRRGRRERQRGDRRGAEAREELSVAPARQTPFRTQFRLLPTVSEKPSLLPTSFFCLFIGFLL